MDEIIRSIKNAICEELTCEPYNIDTNRLNNLCEALYYYKQAGSVERRYVYKADLVNATIDIDAETDF